MTGYSPVVASAIVGIPGPAGGGSPGTVERTGAGSPSNSLGINGDHYLDVATGNYYERQNGAYALVANLKGPAGSILRNGTGAPSNSSGIDGDYYLNNTTGDLYFRSSGSYTIVSNFKGPTGASAGLAAPRVISTGAGDNASSADEMIGWNSSTASSKTEALPAPTTAGKKYVIKDVYGNAATYPIVITPTTGTIDGQASYTISDNNGAVTMIADGNSNYMVVA